MTTEETVRTEPGIPKEEFLKTLTPDDRNNLIQLSDEFKRVMQDDKRQGALIIVGGIMNKLHPRKDIDIVLVRVRKDECLARSLHESQLDFATKDFHDFKNLVTRMITSLRGVEILEEMHPAIDEEFGNPNILKNDGSITIKGTKGLPIELIRDPKGSIEKQITSQKNKFSILTII